MKSDLHPDSLTRWGSIVTVLKQKDVCKVRCMNTLTSETVVPFLSRPLNSRFQSLFGVFSTLSVLLVCTLSGVDPAQAANG